MTKILLLVTLLALLPLTSENVVRGAAVPDGQTQTIRCPATRDVWLSLANREEADTSGGKAARIKLKVLQEFGLLDFDVAALHGKRITGATLHVFATGGGRFGGARGTDLRWFSLSTVSSDWVEGKGEQYARDEAGHGATFNEASYQKRPWTVPGSRCWDVILGNGNSLRGDADGGDPKDGWFSIPLEPRLVQTLVCRASYGLALMDGSTGVDRNCTISSREGEHPPYLEVTTAGNNATLPAAPLDVAIAPAPLESGAKEGAARVSLRVPSGAFAFEVEVNGQPVPRWQIPFAGPGGGAQSFVIEHLTPSAPLQLRIAALDAAGNRSPFVNAQGQSSPALQVPVLPVTRVTADGAQRGAAPVLDGRLKVWALPESCKVDALAGRIVLENGMARAEAHNAVWNAAPAGIRLAAARGEIAACQLALEATAGDVAACKVGVEGLDGIGVKQWRAWFIKAGASWLPEYALPLAPGDALQIPARDNKVPGQKAALVSLDFIVPAGVRPGVHAGTVVVSLGDKMLRLPLNLMVYPTVIPAETSFNPELNCYGGPGEAGSQRFFDSYRLAHYYRSTINTVFYNHATHIDAAWVPDIDAAGHVTDWARFERNIGPLLDGSAFKDNPRAGVPVPLMYLPQSEQWPLLTGEHYHPGVPLAGPDWKPIHDIGAKAPEAAFDKPYQDAFAANVGEYARHFAAKGWTHTRMQGFFNRKYQFYPDRMAGTAWTMDEPSDYLDWQALRFYGRLFGRGLRDSGVAERVRFGFRGDISRPMWQGSLGDGWMNMIYANGEQFSMLPLMRALKQRGPATLVCYGGCNPPDRANHETVAWCLQAYTHECDGVVPWQSLGGDAAFERGDDPDNGNALIVDGTQRFGLDAVASFRVGSLRQGAQLVELLELLRRQKGWSRAHIGLLVSQQVPLDSAWQPKFTDEAAGLRYHDLNGNKWVELKEGVLRLLQQG